MELFKAWIFDLYGVKDLEHLRPVNTRKPWKKGVWKHVYHPEGVPAYQLVKDVTINVKLNSSNNFCVPESNNYGKNLDFTCVSPRVVLLKYVRSNTTESFTVQPTFVHPTMREAMERRTKLLKAMNKVQTSMEIKPFQNCDVSVYIQGEVEECMYLKKPFVKSFMLMNEKRLWNGIVRIPDRVAEAVELPKLCPIFTPEGLEVADPVEWYDLVPGDHVFSWVLRVDQNFLASKGIFCRRLRVAPVNDDAYDLFFIVPHHHVVKVFNNCMANFVHEKIDRRHLGQVGVEMYNEQRQRCNPENVQISATVIFAAHPANIPDHVVIPALDPDFPSYYDTKEYQLFEQKVEEENQQALKMKG